MERNFFKKFKKTKKKPNKNKNQKKPPTNKINKFSLHFEERQMGFIRKLLGELNPSPPSLTCGTPP